MLTLIPWLAFLHMLSAFTFFLAHGTSVAMAFKLRSETDFARIRAMLDLSATTMGVMFFSFLGMGLTGLIMPFILKLWGKGWIWASIVLMIGVFFQMVFMNEKRYKHLRRMVGSALYDRRRSFPGRRTRQPTGSGSVSQTIQNHRSGDCGVCNSDDRVVVDGIQAFLVKRGFSNGGRKETRRETCPEQGRREGRETNPKG